MVQAVKLAKANRCHCQWMVLFVTLDIRKTFNSAKWCHMLKTLEKRFRIIVFVADTEGHLKGRAWLFLSQEEQRRIRDISGATQRTILSPDPQDASYDSVLRLEIRYESHLVGTRIIFGTGLHTYSRTISTR